MRQANARLLVLVVSAFAFGSGCSSDKKATPGGEAQSEGARLPGGTATTWKTVTFDLPPGWTTKPAADGSGGLVLMPPDFGKSGLLDEVYVLVGDGSIHSLEEAGIDEKVQEGVDSVQPGLAMDGAPKAQRFGNTTAKVFGFHGQSADGQDVSASVYAFPTTDGVAALLGLGFPAKLRVREELVRAMLATLRTPKPGAGGGGGGGSGGGAELVGQWVLFTNFNANDGGGRASGTTLNLGADGRYTYRAETVSTNPLGGHASAENDSGRWSVEGDSMVFRSVSGKVSSYTLQKRNHPKNHDPMILLDGSAFVTATQRAPW